MSETDISTAAVERLLDGVTAGPWHVEDDWNVHCGSHSVMHGSIHVVSDAESEANANFTAASRDLVPALLADRDRLAAEVARLTAERDAAMAAPAPQAREITVQEAAEVPEVKALVEAAKSAADALDMAYGDPHDEETQHRYSSNIRAALAAVQKGW